MGDSKIDITKLKAYQTMPNVNTNDAEWIKWSDLVIGKYGTDLGKQIFIQTWQKRGNKNANTRALRTHLKDKGIEIDESVWDRVVDVTGATGDFFGKIFKGAKLTLIIGGSVILIAVGFTVFNAIKQGRAAK